MENISLKNVFEIFVFSLTPIHLHGQGGVYECSEPPDGDQNVHLTFHYI